MMVMSPNFAKQLYRWDLDPEIFPSSNLKSFQSVWVARNQSASIQRSQKRGVSAVEEVIEKVAASLAAAKED